MQNSEVRSKSAPSLSELNTLVGTLQTWTSTRGGKFLFRPDRLCSAVIVGCRGRFVNRIVDESRGGASVPGVYFMARTL